MVLSCNETSIKCFLWKDHTTKTGLLNCSYKWVLDKSIISETFTFHYFFLNVDSMTVKLTEEFSRLVFQELFHFVRVLNTYKRWERIGKVTEEDKNPHTSEMIEK